MLFSSSLIAMSCLASEATLVAQRGERVHCVHKRAHILRFDVAGEANDGSSLEGIDRAIISLEPSAAHEHLCQEEPRVPRNLSASGENACCTCVRYAGGKACAEDACMSASTECTECVKNAGGVGCIDDGRCSCAKPTAEGTKALCYGANQDSSCSGAAAELPINEDFGCKDCFVSISADAYYWLDFSKLQLRRVQAGLKNAHLRASASLHTLLQGQAKVATGSIPVFGTKTLTVVDTLVGCPVCVKVKIEVGAPTSIDYDLRVSGEVDLQAGVALDVNLGNNIATYDSETGWSHETQNPVVTAKPLLSAKASTQADFTFGVSTQLQVIIDDIFWYHLTMSPSIPATLTFKGDTTIPSGDLCLDATAKFSMTQEADLNWNLIVWKAKEHWGPSTLWSWQLPTALHYCKNFGASSLAMLAV